MRSRPMTVLLTLGAATLLSGCASIIRGPESEAFERTYPAVAHQQVMRDGQRAGGAEQALRTDGALRKQASRTDAAAHDLSTPVPSAVPPSK